MGGYAGIKRMKLQMRFVEIRTGYKIFSGTMRNQ